MFFNEESKIGINDRVFDLKAGIVEKVRYNFTSTDKQYIKMRQSVPNYIYLKYIIRNIGAGSAVDMKVSVNDFSEKISIAKDETVTLFLIISMEKEENIPFNIIIKQKTLIFMLMVQNKRLYRRSILYQLKFKKCLVVSHPYFTTNFTTNSPQ